MWDSFINNINILCIFLYCLFTFLSSSLPTQCCKTLYIFKSMFDRTWVLHCDSVLFEVAREREQLNARYHATVESNYKQCLKSLEMNYRASILTKITPQKLRKLNRIIKLISRKICKVSNFICHFIKSLTFSLHFPWNFESIFIMVPPICILSQLLIEYFALLTSRL